MNQAFVKSQLEKFDTVEKLHFVLQDCRGLSRLEVDEIKKSVVQDMRNLKEDYYERMGCTKSEYVIIETFLTEKLFYPGLLWSDWNDLSNGEKISKVIRLQLNLNELMEVCSAISNGLRAKYQNQTPYQVENYLLHWERIIQHIERLGATYGHNLKRNPYYPFIENWLNELKVAYSTEKLQARAYMLEANNKTVLKKAGNQKAIESDNHQPKEINVLKDESGKVETFDDLFFDKTLIASCVRVLRELDTSAVTEDLKAFIGPSGVAVVWMQELKNKNFIQALANTKYADLLKQKFKGFSVDPSMFGQGKIPKSAEKSRSEIKALLQKLQP